MIQCHNGKILVSSFRSFDTNQEKVLQKLFFKSQLKYVLAALRLWILWSSRIPTMSSSGRSQNHTRKMPQFVLRHACISIYYASKQARKTMHAYTLHPYEIVQHHTKAPHMGPFCGGYLSWAIVWSQISKLRHFAFCIIMLKKLTKMCPVVVRAWVLSSRIPYHECQHRCSLRRKTASCSILHASR